MALTQSIGVNYEDINQSATTIKDTVINVNDIINEANKAVNDLNNESTFYGPIADYCLANWNTIAKLTLEDNSTLSTSGTTLTTIGQNYEDSDKQSGESVGGV